MMQLDNPSDEPLDDRRFNDALNALLRAAHDDGVELEGSWPCRNDDSRPDWDVTITPVGTSPASD